MSTIDQNMHRDPIKQHGTPWSHVIGFLASLILTAIPLWMVQTHALSPRLLFTLILSFAVLQIVVQLFFFMHVRESEGPAWHVWMLGLGMFFTICIVAGSIWIMTFGSEAY